jgi:hypothetical protein
MLNASLVSSNAISMKGVSQNAKGVGVWNINENNINNIIYI